MTASVTYLRDITLVHICSWHLTSHGCRQRPWDCKANCGTPINRHAAHRPSNAPGPECVVCVYMQYELERLNQ